MVNKTTLDDSGERIENAGDEQNSIPCPRIVSEELWMRVEELLANESSPQKASANAHHSFSGILFCKCGGRMNPATSSPKYVCAQCGNRIPISDLENLFLDEVTNFLKTRKKTATDIFSASPDLIAERELFEQTQNKARQIDEEISKAERLYMENRISVERFEKLHHPLEEDRRAIQRKLGTIKAKLTRMEAKHPANREEQPFNPATLKARWRQISRPLQRDIVRSFVHRIVVSDDDIEFSYRFRDSSERTPSRQHSSTPTNSVAKTSDEPLYIRLPKAGERCPRTGMSRSALNALILPTEENSYNPPVESKCLRKREDGKGTRLIVWQSLKEYLDKSN